MGAETYYGTPPKTTQENLIFSALKCLVQPYWIGSSVSATLPIFRLLRFGWKELHISLLPILTVQ
jgi:hypothetical protein